MRERAGRHVDHHVDLAGQQGRHGWSKPAIGYELITGAGDVLKKDPSDVPGTTDA